MSFNLAARPHLAAFETGHYAELLSSRLLGLFIETYGVWAHDRLQIANTITAIVTAVRTADSRLTGLATELSQLTQYLQSVHRALVTCRAADLNLIEDELWRQSEVCLAGCQSTLNELAQVVNKVKSNARKMKVLGSIGWKSRAALDLKLKGPELECFRERIYKSNSALQTMLHAVNVYVLCHPHCGKMIADITHSSLSIRNNASQNSIFVELGRLKSSIDAALNASSSSSPFCTASQNNASRNLRDLASAARTFHSAASSSASTVRGDDRSVVCSSNEPWQSNPGATLSLQGDLPSWKRERVEMYISQDQEASYPRRQDSSTSSFGRPPSTRPVSPIELDKTLSAHVREPLEKVEIMAQERSTEPFEKRRLTEDEDDEDEFERAFTIALQQLALDRIKAGHYGKAVEFIYEALQRFEVDAKANDEALVSLRTQCALCYVLQGNWTLAEPLIMSLENTKPEADSGSLLCALTMNHLATFSFESALVTCRLALRNQRRRCKAEEADWAEYWGTMGLLATIYEVMGECIRAEVVRSQIPHCYVYVHPPSVVEYLMGQHRFLHSLLGDYQLSMFLRGGYHDLDCGSFYRSESQVPQLYAGRNAQNGNEILAPTQGGTWEVCNVSQLRMNWSKHERMELDTCKEVVVTPSSPTCEQIVTGDEADDEFSPLTPSTEAKSPLKHRLPQLLRPRRLKDAEDSSSPVSLVSPFSAITPKSATASDSSWWRTLGRRKSRTVLKRRESPTGAHNEEVNESGFKLLKMQRVVTSSPQNPTNLSLEEQSANEGCVEKFAVSEAPLLELDSDTIQHQGNTDSAKPIQGDNTSLICLRQSQLMPESSGPVVFRPKNALSRHHRPTGLKINTSLGRTRIPSSIISNSRATPLPDHLTGIIRQLSELFSSLPAIDADEIGPHAVGPLDANALRCKIDELRKLRLQMRDFGFDYLVVTDIEQAIRRLEDLASWSSQPSNDLADDGAQASDVDSGYESVESSRQRASNIQTSKSSRRISAESTTNSTLRQQQSTLHKENPQPDSHVPARWRQNGHKDKSPAVWTCERGQKSENEPMQRPAQVPISRATTRGSFRAGDDNPWIQNLVKPRLEG